MLLERLREYTDQVQLADSDEGQALPSGYTKQPIRWIIQLDTKGRLQGAPIPTSSGVSRRDRGKRFPAPYLRRSGTNVKTQLLADKAEFVLGIPPKDDERHKQRAQRRHRDFVALVQACNELTAETAVEAVNHFLQERTSVQVPDLVEISPNDSVTFRVDDCFPMNLPTVEKFWVKISPHLSERGIGELTVELIKTWWSREGVHTEASAQWECILCGEACSPARVHPVAIKLPRPVADQQYSIVTANKEAFESYGLEQALTAPTCHRCAEQYAKAVNRLVQQDDTHITIGRLVYIFWTKEDVGFSVTALLSNPQPEEVRELIASAFSGKRTATGICPTPFYATAFSASGGRVVVRDWLDTTVAEVQRHLARYFALQRIVGWDRTEAKPYGLYALAASTVRDLRQELPPNVPKVLLHLALKGGLIPRWLLFQAIKRNRAEQRITQPRAALIRMALLSWQYDFQPEDSIMVELDTNNREPAYLCGQLLAALEFIQQAAISARSTIIDRFYGTASSAPASVFGRLLRGAQPHLGKLREEKPGAHVTLQRLLENIIRDGLSHFPRTLTLEQQGLFALGYYHQRAAGWGVDREADMNHPDEREAK